MEKRTRGRPKGTFKKNLIYKVKVYDILKDEWNEAGDFLCMHEISKRFDLSYDNVRDIGLNRNKRLCKYYNIEKADVSNSS
jgi:hypothetical protein